MGANTSKDEIFRKEIGCDTIEGECALFVADFEKKCVEGCKCYEGYLGEYCQFRSVPLLSAVGIVGTIIGIFLLILFVVLIICCCQSARKRRRLNREWERRHNNPSEVESSRTTEDRRDILVNSTDRPRSGYYEHEFLQNPRDNANRSLYPNLDVSNNGLDSLRTTIR
nr:hypothetical transcript [Hymenolepis microstoma]